VELVRSMAERVIQVLVTEESHCKKDHKNDLRANDSQNVISNSALFLPSAVRLG
jgi:hypothetical protein